MNESEKLKKLQKQLALSINSKEVLLEELKKEHKKLKSEISKFESEKTRIEDETTEFKIAKEKAKKDYEIAESRFSEMEGEVVVAREERRLQEKAVELLKQEYIDRQNAEDERRDKRKIQVAEKVAEAKKATEEILSMFKGL